MEHISGPVSRVMAEIAESRQAVTCDEWEDEAASAAELDRTLSGLGLWRVYTEVEGTLIQPRPAQQSTRVRIDRVLLPTPALAERGWRHGAIGIEIKKSGIKIGPPLAQILDYARGVWTLPPAGVRIVLDYVFLWPAMKQRGTVASLLAHARIGTAISTEWDALRLTSGEHVLCSISRDGEIRIGSGAPGAKVGAR